MTERKGTTVSFANNKGGVGKTTTVAAVGQAWARAGKKVLFVDLDSQANLTNLVSKVPYEERSTTIRDAFVYGAHKLPIENVSENVDLIPSGLLLANFDMDTAAKDSREHLLEDLLDPLKSRYDVILIDCPPALGMISYNALIASDYIVLVTMLDQMSYDGMMNMLEICKLVRSKKRLNPNLKTAGVIACRYERNRISDLFLARLRRELEYYFIEPPVRKATKMAQAVAVKMPVFDYDPTGNATKDYVEVAAHLGLIVFSEEEKGSGQ